jgi:hypothetical protein
MAPVSSALMVSSEAIKRGPSSELNHLQVTYLDLGKPVKPPPA